MPAPRLVSVTLDNDTRNDPDAVEALTATLRHTRLVDTVRRNERHDDLWLTVELAPDTSAEDAHRAEVLIREIPGVFQTYDGEI
jgi:hypothetical protein